jgi:hypothetical protein
MLAWFTAISMSRNPSIELHGRRLELISSRIIESAPEPAGWCSEQSLIKLRSLLSPPANHLFGNLDFSRARARFTLAFRASSREAVNHFHAAGLAAGARDNGAPGVRTRDYYCAFLIDPDGINLEAGTYSKSGEDR